jgi:transcription elongation GreA/GreB family factor
MALPAWVQGTSRPVQVVTIVPPGYMGPHRLTPRTPLAMALLGHQVGDVVDVEVDAGTVWFTIMAIGGDAELDESLGWLFGGADAGPQ